MGKISGVSDHQNFSISPKYRVSSWLDARNNNSWEQMTDIFWDRLDSRYIKPIRLIASDSQIGEFSGFSILAIDCLVIETLSQFYSGCDETQGRNNEAFWNFFKGSDYFRHCFTRKQAHVFYSHFRCGILHQAQTKKKSVVRIRRSAMIDYVNGTPNDGLIVDREKFHAALEHEICAYRNRLLEGDAMLRANFIKKMNFICGV